MVIMLFTLLTIFVGSGVSVNASSYIAEKQGGIFSEKTQNLLDLLNEAYPGYFCYVPENERDPDIPSYEMSDEEFYQLLMSLNATQELFVSKGTNEVNPLLISSKQENDMKSALYGAAVPYYNNTSPSVNCYGYAMIQPVAYNPGYMTGSYYIGAPVNYIASFVISDYIARGLDARLIGGGLAGISYNEYRIATRTGNGYVNGVLTYDYHFMRQTDIGEWAEKRGPGPSANRGAIDPAVVSWDLYYVSGAVAVYNFYNSTTYFLAVRLY